MLRVNLKNSATNLFGVSSMRLFSSLVFAMTTTISSLIFVTYTSLSVASLNFEYVHTFSSHREFRSDDALDEALYFIERVSLCSE